MTDKQLQELYTELSYHESYVLSTNNVSLISEYFYWLGALAAHKYKNELPEWFKEYEDTLRDLAEEIKSYTGGHNE
jgi:uncharacterized membrane protein YfbV (UPF0208 family)